MPPQARTRVKNHKLVGLLGRSHWKGVGEGVPVEVVGVGDDELVDRPEMSVDAVEVAGIGRDRDEFDVVLGGELADVGGPVRRQDRPSWIQ